MARRMNSLFWYAAMTAPGTRRSSPAAASWSAGRLWLPPSSAS